MKVFKICSYFLLYFAISACSNTAQLNLKPKSNHYYANNFSHTQFTAYHQYSVKTAASSDRQLMLSLLNRPIPEDQRMMLTFAKRQENYFPDSTMVGIQIKGDKRSDKFPSQNASMYADMINQDNNSVSISAMPK
ncbi:hypothetical protein [Colwellia piezophila]|uniref:hypothetical protein n=1 Tax=Colwellia piezophila TaxID=211668 RepID=UPI0003607FF2|nr:hypothetical protein [Colwellia piezophila]